MATDSLIERSASMERFQKGVTLMELLIVVVIVGILAAIAYPSYRAQVMRSHRSDAKIALERAAQTLERCFTNSNPKGLRRVCGAERQLGQRLLRGRREHSGRPRRPDLHIDGDGRRRAARGRRVPIVHADRHQRAHRQDLRKRGQPRRLLGPLTLFILSRSNCRVPPTARDISFIAPLQSCILRARLAPGSFYKQMSF